MKLSVWVSFFIPYPIAVFLSFLRLCFFFFPYRTYFLSCSLSCPSLFICSVPTDKNLTQSPRAMCRSDQKHAEVFVLLLTQKKMFMYVKQTFSPYGLSYLPHTAVMTSETDRSSHTVTQIKADTFIPLACDFFFSHFFFSHPLYMQRCQSTIPQSSICAA